MLNNNIRYQKGLTLGCVFPKIDGYCACGCGKELRMKHHKWASETCRTNSYIHFAIIKGNNDIIRDQTFKRDQGFCLNCGVYDENWQADHITPVHIGGGACGLENIQTLCIDCHKNKTYNNFI